MKRFFLLLVLTLMIVQPLHLTNSYLRTAEFATITVAGTENISGIAHRYAPDENSAEELQQAIIEINALTPDGAVREGQTLRIPLRDDSTPAAHQLASR